MVRALKVAFRVGILPNDFFRLTPYLLSLCVQSHNRLRQDDRERDVWLAWHTAAFHRVDKLKPYAEIAKSIRPPTKREVANDLMAALSSWVPPLPKD